MCLCGGRDCLLLPCKILHQVLRFSGSGVHVRPSIPSELLINGNRITRSTGIRNSLPGLRYIFWAMHPNAFTWMPSTSTVSVIHGQRTAFLAHGHLNSRTQALFTIHSIRGWVHGFELVHTYSLRHGYHRSDRGIQTSEGTDFRNHLQLGFQP